MFGRLNTPGNRNILLEIAMIVIGINVALWLEGWFEDLRDAETEQLYLAGLRDDLQADIELLDQIIELNTDRQRLLSDVLPRLASFAEASPEEQARSMFVPSSYHFFEPSDFTYRSMQESGDFRLLSDTDTKKRLLQVVRLHRLVETLQQNFMQAMDDGYIPLLMSGFDLVEQRVTDPSILDDQVFRNFFAFTYQDIEMRLGVYRELREGSDELLRIIEAQIED